MTDRGVSDYDMPNRTWPSADLTGIPDRSLETLLEGATPAADTPMPLQHVADVLAALRVAPAADEAAGHTAAIAEFRRQIGGSSRLRHRSRRRPALLTPPPLLRTRIGAAATAAVVGMSALAAAAYAGALPAAAQQVAHDTIGAPRPAPKPAAGLVTSHRGTPVGPDASGHPAFGLCTAYLAGKERGRAAEKSVAFRNLEHAAGGADNVLAYCAGVTHPGSGRSTRHHQGGGSKASSSTRPTGKPPHR
jgi:hypothetical protein